LFAFVLLRLVDVLIAALAVVVGFSSLPTCIAMKRYEYASMGVVAWAGSGSIFWPGFRQPFCHVFVATFSQIHDDIVANSLS